MTFYVLWLVEPRHSSSVKCFEEIQDNSDHKVLIAKKRPIKKSPVKSVHTLTDKKSCSLDCWIFFYPVMINMDINNSILYKTWFVSEHTTETKYVWFNCNLCWKVNKMRVAVHSRHFLGLSPFVDRTVVIIGFVDSWILSCDPHLLS